jgi:phage terminase Nu1 subunit (DNA packaging protein)
MNGEHFKEIVEVVCATKGITKKQLHEVLRVSDFTFRRWQKNGVPITGKRIVVERLRKVLFA